MRPGVPTSEAREEANQLTRENAELRKANQKLRAASVLFRGGARRRPVEVTALIDKYRRRFGVELICRTLEVSASAYYRRKTGERSARSVDDERLDSRIRELHRENYECHASPLVVRGPAR